MYVKALAILLLLVGAFFFGRETGIDHERAKRTEDAEKAGRQRAKAEIVIVKDRVVWRDRIQTIEKSADTCLIPADILRVLADAGIYVGPL